MMRTATSWAHSSCVGNAAKATSVRLCLGIDNAVLMKAWYLVVPSRLLQSTLFVFAVAEQRLHHVGLRPEASGFFEHRAEALLTRSPTPS